MRTAKDTFTKSLWDCTQLAFKVTQNSGEVQSQTASPSPILLPSYVASQQQRHFTHIFNYYFALHA
jgi:hypothetical protein